MPNRIRTKILAVFFTSFLITVIGYLLLYYQFLEKNELTSHIIEEDQPATLAWVKLMNGMNHALAAQRGWILFGTEALREERLQAWEQEISPMQEQLKTLYVDQQYEGVSVEEVRKFFDIRLRLLQLEKQQKEIEQIAHTPENIPAQHLFSSQIEPLITTMIHNLTTILDQVPTKTKSTFLNSIVEAQRTLWLSLFQLKEYVVEGKQANWDTFQQTWTQNKRWLMDLNTTTTSVTTIQQSHLRQLIENQNQVIGALPDLFQLRHIAAWNIARNKMEHISIPLAKEIEKQIRSIVKKQSEYAWKNNKKNQQGYAQWKYLFLSFTFAVSLFWYVFAHFLGRQIVVPLRELRDAVRKVKDEDFYGRIEVSSLDEVGELAQEFQEMLEALKERTKEANRSRQILHNSPSPVMQVTPEKRLVYINPAAQLQLKNLAEFLPAAPENMVGKTIDFLIDRSTIDYQHLLTPYQFSPTVDISLGSQILEVTFNPLFDAAEQYLGVVLHWRNATQERQLVAALETQSLAKQKALEQLEAQNQRLRDQLELDQAQSSIAQAITSLDMSSILEAALETLVKTTNSQLGVIYIQEGKQLSLKHHYTVDENVMDSEFYQVQGLPTQISNTQKSIHIHNPDPSQGKAFHLGVVANYPKAIIGYPLVFQKQCHGVLLLSSVSAFRENLIPFIENTVSQLAVAIQNALTFQTVQSQQQTLETANVELEIATRTKSEFLANMSHELRTPLNAVIGFAEALLDTDEENPLNEYQQDRLSRIHKSGQNLLGLINSLLDLSKIEAGRMEITIVRFELKELLDHVVISLESLATSKQIHLELALDTDDFICLSDPDKIRQVLINLLGNAIKFTDEGGRVTVAISKEKDWFSIAVEDTGCGIPEAQQENIFDAFEQAPRNASNRQEGTGLGLSLVKSMIQLLGGRVTVSSQIDEGSTFTLHFPATLEEKEMNRASY